MNTIDIGETASVSHSNSFDTILNSSNGSIYDRDTINGSSVDIFETSTLHDSELDVLHIDNHNTVTISDAPKLSNSPLDASNLTNNSNNNTDYRRTINRSPFFLKCGSLNVCGIKRKLLYPELCELISEYDLFCVTETKIDSYDIIALPGYKILITDS